MHLNELGEIIRREWFKTAEIRKEILLDSFIIMPDHFHGIIHIRNVGAHGYAPRPVDDHAPRPVYDHAPQPTNNYAPRPVDCILPRSVDDHAPISRKPKSLSTWVAGFKWGTTRIINGLRRSPGMKIWQRNYYERVLRNEGELNAVREYIKMNPTNWGTDTLERGA